MTPLAAELMRRNALMASRAAARSTASEWSRRRARDCAQQEFQRPRVNPTPIFAPAPYRRAPVLLARAELPKDKYQRSSTPTLAAHSRTTIPRARTTPWSFFACDMPQVKETPLNAKETPLLRIQHPEVLSQDRCWPPVLLTRPIDPHMKRLAFGPFAFKLSPSCEALAWLCCTSAREWLAGKRVLEVGAGLGLTGLICATWCECASVCLTDGDPTSVSAIRANVELNQQAGSLQSPVDVAQLEWDNLGACSLGHRKFDAVLCADCVYDRAYHSSLVATLKRFLHPFGRVMLVASKRCGSLEDFAQVARVEFAMEDLGLNYDNSVKQRFQSQKCFPRVLTLAHKTPALLRPRERLIGVHVPQERTAQA